jgi:hypothetical protein
MRSSIWPWSGFDGDGGIDEAGGADDQFDDLRPSAQADFAVGRGGADVDGLALEGLEFVEVQRTVIEGAGEAETVLDQDGFAGEVAGVHAADLGTVACDSSMTSR